LSHEQAIQAQALGAQGSQLGAMLAHERGMQSDAFDHYSAHIGGLLAHDYPMLDKQISGQSHLIDKQYQGEINMLNHDYQGQINLSHVTMRPSMIAAQTARSESRAGIVGDALGTIAKFFGG